MGWDELIPEGRVFSQESKKGCGRAWTHKTKINRGGFFGNLSFQYVRIDTGYFPTIMVHDIAPRLFSSCADIIYTIERKKQIRSSLLGREEGGLKKWSFEIHPSRRDVCCAVYTETVYGHSVTAEEGMRDRRETRVLKSHFLPLVPTFFSMFFFFGENKTFSMRKVYLEISKGEFHRLDFFVLLERM